MSRTRTAQTELPGPDDTVTIGCLIAYVIEEARRRNCGGMAEKLDKCLDGLMQDMDRDTNQRIILASYGLMTANLPREPAALKLVHSRP